MPVIQKWVVRQEGGQKYRIVSPHIEPTEHRSQKHKSQWVTLYQLLRVDEQEKSSLPYGWLDLLLNIQDNTHEMCRHW